MDLEALQSTSDDFLEGLVPGLQQQLEQGEAHERELVEKMNEQRQLNQRLRTILRAVNPDLVPSRTDVPAVPEPNRHTPARRATHTRIGRKQKSGTATGYGISMEAAIPFADACKKMQEEFGYVTQKPVYQGLDADQGTCSAAFQWFLAIGFLRRVGQVERRTKFVIVNSEAPYAALRQAEEAAS